MPIARHVTARGEPFDMSKLRSTNSTKPALGNANMNARGDIIDKAGTILKTQEQIVAEWKANKIRREASTRPVDIKSESLIPDFHNKKQPVISESKSPINNSEFEISTEPELIVQVENIKTENKAQSPRRKITETDK